MRLALLSDLHGNAVALEAVLDSLAGSDVDQLVCLGDVATLGPSPSTVIERLANLDCLCVRGNHDEFLLEPGRAREYTQSETVIADIECCRQRLSRDALAFVGSFQPLHRLEIEGVRLLLFHGTPRSNTENLLVTATSEHLDAILREHPVDLLAGGHTHVQMLRRHGNALFVNPGSVGQPFLIACEPGEVPAVLSCAEYALVDIEHGRLEVSLRRVALDGARLLQALESWDSPMRAFLESQYR